MAEEEPSQFSLDESSYEPGTSRQRISSESSDSHSQVAENTPLGPPTNSSPNESFVSGSFEDSNSRPPVLTEVVSVRDSFHNMYVVHERREIDKHSVIDNLLPVPACHLYNDINSPYVYEVASPEYREKAIRVISFSNWALVSPSPETLASANMIYFGEIETEDGTLETDMVYCYKCGASMCRFAPTDNPIDEHRRLFPSCFEKDWI